MCIITVGKCYRYILLSRSQYEWLDKIRRTAGKETPFFFFFFSAKKESPKTIFLIYSISLILFTPLFLRLWFLWPEDASIRNKRNRNRCGCLGGCRFFGGTNMGLDFFKLEDLMPSSSSAFSSSSTESDMCYGQSLLQPGECIITKETPKVDGKIYSLFSTINKSDSPFKGKNKE